MRDATIENHQFRDIKVDLTHKNGLADLKVDSHNAGADFTGQVSSRLTSEGRPTSADLQLDVRHFSPTLFGLNLNGLTGTMGANSKFRCRHSTSNILSAK